MSYVIELPAADSPAVDHADWIELVALSSSDGQSSYEGFVSQIHISGTTDVLEGDEEDDKEDDGGGELSSEVADQAWAEIERRHKACGGDAGHYPFTVTAGAITLRDEHVITPYVFQLLLSTFGRLGGPQGTYGERIFEHLSAVAGKSYLGGDANQARFYRFGFPRPDRTGFENALHALCKELQCGKVKIDAALMGDQQDSHLDVVVWRPFDDEHESQLIGFGQCATGKHWEGKLAEMQPCNVLNEWLDDRFYPDPPARMFFVPRCVPSVRWRHVTIHAGLVFDRCRIARLAGMLEQGIRKEVEDWSGFVLGKVKEASN